MNATISLDNLLTTLMSLSKSNKKWIADHLYESIKKEEQATPMISREEFLNDLEAAFQEVKDIKSGKLQPITLEEL